MGRLFSNHLQLQADTLQIGYGPFQRVETEKWVKYLSFITQRFFFFFFFFFFITHFPGVIS